MVLFEQRSQLERVAQSVRLHQQSESLKPLGLATKMKLIQEYLTHAGVERLEKTRVGEEFMSWWNLCGFSDNWTTVLRIQQVKEWGHKFSELFLAAEEESLHSVFTISNLLTGK